MLVEKRKKMAKSPTIPKGTRDFSPSEMRKRNYVFQIIKQSFEKYGFEQIETPSMENLETLTGKYGDEGDKLILKFLIQVIFYQKLNLITTVHQHLLFQIFQKKHYDTT